MRRPWKHGVLACALACGCAGYEARPLDPSRIEEEFDKRDLSDARLKAFVEANTGASLPSFPPPAWDLPALTLVALYYHPDLDVARARLEQAGAGIRSAGAWPNPTVGVDLERVTNPQAMVSPWVYGFRLDMPLDTAWKRGARVEKAERLRDAAYLELGEVAWRVRSRLRAALLDHLLALRELELRRSEESVRGEVATALERRLAVGEIFRLDVDAAQAELGTSRVALLAAEGRVAETRVLIAAALGVPIKALEGALFVWPGLEAPPAEQSLPLSAVQSAGLLNRLDLRRLLAEYAALEAALKLELAKRYPDVTLGPGWLWDQGDRKFTLGFSVVLPVLNQNAGPIAEAEARRKEMGARFVALQAQAIADIEVALARYRAGRAMLAEAERTAALVERREKTARRGVELGEMDRVALIGIRLEAVIASAARLEAVKKAQVSLGLLEDAVERPLVEAGSIPEVSPIGPREPREELQK